MGSLSTVLPQDSETKVASTQLLAATTALFLVLTTLATPPLSLTLRMAVSVFLRQWITSATLALAPMITLNRGIKAGIPMGLPHSEPLKGRRSHSSQIS